MEVAEAARAAFGRGEIAEEEVRWNDAADHYARAARLDPTRVRVADLGETRIDPFAREVRQGLRKKHGLDCTRPIGVTAVFSEEPPTAPVALAYDDGAFRCVCPGGDNGKNDCEHRNRVEGSVAFVPSVFGLTAASVAVRMLLGVDAAAPGVAATPEGDA